MNIFTLEIKTSVIFTFEMMSYNPEKPFNDLPSLPPQGGIETIKILKKTISASRALAELKGAITNLPNPTLFVDTINLQEAQASSAIENIITTQDELYKASISDKKLEGNATKEVIHYKDALWHGFEELNRRPILNTNLFIAIMQIIKENTSGIRNTPGTKLTNPLTGKVVYTPPEGEEIIRNKLRDLENFIHAEDAIDPLIRLALIHYQFEAIHPFADGNGRTGRILLLLYLKYTNLMELPALYLSDYVNRNRQAYYTGLRLVTEKGEWETWILYMLDMVESSAIKGRLQIIQIEKLMTEMAIAIQTKISPKVYSKELVETLFKLPYTKRSFLVAAGIGNLKTVGNYLNVLEKAGLLQSEYVGKEKLYLNFQLMNILKS